MSMMTPHELREHINALRLTKADAAQLLNVSPRTVSRWFEGEEVPGPVEQAFRAWRRLHERNLAWRPDTVAITDDDQQQIAAHRAHAISTSDILARVEARGGPRLPWLVDRAGCRAILGAMEVSFYKLANGGFSLANYTCKNGTPDVQRDWEYLEDAVFCIAKEMKKEAPIPVTLVYLNAPLFYGPNDRIGTIRTEEFSSNERALERACELIRGSSFYSPCIREGTSTKPGDIIWLEPELRRECERRQKMK
jgi:hypothetical protein